MAGDITVSGVHHVRMIVTDVARSMAFYTGLLNFELAVELPPGVVLSNGNMLLGMTLAWDSAQALENDKFSPHRVGLDHISFSVGSRADLQKALALFEEKGVVHGEITDLTPFGISILSFNDPDGIQLELTAPIG